MDDERTYLQTTLRIRDGFENLEMLSDNLNDKISNKMPDKDKKRLSVIVKYIVGNEYISTKEASEILKLDVKTARRLLFKAIEAGKFVAVGANKNRKYMLL